MKFYFIINALLSTGDQNAAISNKNRVSIKIIRRPKPTGFKEDLNLTGFKEGAWYTTLVHTVFKTID